MNNIESTDNKLKLNERIIYRARLHWGLLLGPILFIFVGYLMLSSKNQQAYVVLAFGIIWGIVSYIKFRVSEIILTDTRLLINIGFPLKKSFDIPLNDITHFDFYQPSLGTMLNFGKVILVLNDKKKKAFRFISSPAELVRNVHMQAVSVRENKKPAARKRKSEN